MPSLRSKGPTVCAVAYVARCESAQTRVRIGSAFTAGPFTLGKSPIAMYLGA